MLKITHRKVAAFDVRWAHFPGFTILFNNPGNNCFRQRGSGIFDLVNDVYHDPSLNFYKILHENLTKLDIDSLTNRFLFCPLSPTSYHATVFSGLNCRNVSEMDSDYRPIVENWLSTLPDAFLNTPKEILDLAEISPLCTKHDWNIDFRFNGLNIWNHSVLVATLRPHENSMSEFEELTEERRQLNQKYYERFHIFTESDIFKPHVSLGYFANEEGAQKAAEFLDEWNALFVNALEDKTLTFNDASVYGLSDMITFYKRSI